MSKGNEQFAQDQRRERMMDELRDYLGVGGTRVLERLHILAAWAREDAIDTTRYADQTNQERASAAIMRLSDLFAIIEERTTYYRNHPSRLN